MLIYKFIYDYFIIYLFENPLTSFYQVALNE